MKHKKVKMTFNEFDELVEKLLSVNMDKPKSYPPLKDLLDANELDDKSHSILNYMIWLSETLDTPVTQEEAEFKKVLHKILNERIYLYDEEDANNL